MYYKLYLLKCLISRIISYYHWAVFTILGKVNAQWADAYYYKTEAKAEEKYYKEMKKYY